VVQQQLELEIQKILVAPEALVSGVAVVVAPPETKLAMAELVVLLQLVVFEVAAEAAVQEAQVLLRLAAMVVMAD
jgi:hypothetical protein